MSEIKQIQSILEITPKLDACCIDMFGVLWDGTQFFPNALNTLYHLKQAGKKIYILSNATEPQKQAEEKYASFGLKVGIHYDAFLSSGTVLEMEVEKGFFERFSGKKNYRFYMIGNKPHTLFQNIADHMTPDMNAADFVYFGSPSTKETAALNIDHLMPELEQALSLNKKAVIANPDYHAFKGPIKYCAQGTMGKWYEDRGGSVYWIGKPYPLIYQYALNFLQCPAHRVLMIGDTIRTDIAGGKNAGMKTLLITGTGITASALQQGLDLQTLCRMEEATPDYQIERFQ